MADTHTHTGKRRGIKPREGARRSGGAKERKKKLPTGEEKDQLN